MPNDAISYLAICKVCKREVYEAENQIYPTTSTQHVDDNSPLCRPPQPVASPQAMELAGEIVDRIISFSGADLIPLKLEIAQLVSQYTQPAWIYDRPPPENTHKVWALFNPKYYAKTPALHCSGELYTHGYENGVFIAWHPLPIPPQPDEG